MAFYKYKAISNDGAKVHGVIEAYDEFEAIGHIKETCSIVTSIVEVKAAVREGKDIFAPAVIGDKPLSLLCSQFGIILKAGLPLVRAVELIREQTTDKRLKELLGKVASDVEAGYGLAQSFESKGGKQLPTTFIETVRAGEDSGTLEVSFEKLHTYFEKAATVKNKVKSAMTYPIFLMILAAVVIAVIMIFTMPTFTEMFASMNMELPALTKGIVAVSEFMAKFWWLVIALIVAAVIGFKVYGATEQGGLKLSRMQLKLPVLGKVAKMKGASQFANTLSTLLTAGIPLVRASGVTAKVLDNRYLGYRLGLLTPSLEEGRSLGDMLKQEDIMPSMLSEMTAMGETSGSLEETLTTIGEYYDVEAQLASDKAVNLLQPAITVVMGIIIGVIVIGLYLPMFTMYLGM